METELLALLDRYNEVIPAIAGRQYVPLMRDCFIQYIMEEYNDCRTLKSLFSQEMTRNGIINAAVDFVRKNENIHSKSRLAFFLNALNSFFSKIILEEFPNPNIRAIQPFAGLSDEICELLENKGIILNDIEEYPCISDEEFKYIMKYLESNPPKSQQAKQKHIIIKLYLLYGIRPIKISNLKLSDYNFSENILDIHCSIRNDIIIKLELPRTLSLEIEKYVSQRKENLSEYLFCTSTGKKIDNSFINVFLAKVKKEFMKNCPDEPEEEKNSFTPTGLQKYAIVKMIESGMNQSIIMDFTGQMDTVVNDCQQIVDEKKALNRNRYINHMIRGIETYDLV